MSAVGISNTVDKDHAVEREKTYMALASKYDRSELECLSSMFAEVVNGLEEDADQDFLGDLFMALELGNEHKGQFFTPYSVCRMTAKMTYGKDLEAKIDQRGWVSVNDPACGAGALLVAFANECRLRHTNYQTSVLFVAQDIDHIVGCMCYIQLREFKRRRQRIAPPSPSRWFPPPALIGWTFLPRMPNMQKREERWGWTAWTAPS